MTDLSIVIVNYNTRDLLQECLESLLRERDGLDCEIIVVDNDSRDGSADMVRSYAPEVTLINPGHNTWFTGGNNRGAAHADGEFVWLLNPDTVILPGVLATLVDYLWAHPDVQAATCRMVYPDRRDDVQRTTSQIPQYIDLLLDYTFLGALLSGWHNARRRQMWYADWDRDTTRAVQVLPGSNLLVRRTVYEELGGLNEDLKLYFPEDDFARRFHARGYRAHFVAEATILHHEHASVKQVQRLASQIYFDDLLTYCRAHFGLWRAGLLHALVIPTRTAMDLAQRLRGEKRALA